MKFLVLAAAVLLVSCDEAATRPSSPETAVRAFNDAVRKGDSTAAYALISKESRSLMEKRATAISTASTGVIKNEPALMLLQTGFKTTEPTALKTVDATDTGAFVEVTRGTDSSRLHLVKEDGVWVIDITALFTGAAP